MSTKLFTIHGTVISGRHRGAGMGFPTINLETADPLPPFGIYAGWAEVNSMRYTAAIHIGPVPVFGDTKTSVEAHLLDFDGDLYGQLVTLTCVERIRDVLNFPDAAALRKQIELDIARVREIVE